MNSFSAETQPAGLSRLKLFLALSRTPHGLLDMATPALCALLWLGKLPEPRVIILGLITTFAGYTAVYALNDVIDWRADREKLQKGGFRNYGNYLDAVMVRHPMAQGLLSFKEGLLWTTAWSLLALTGAYMLNPVCMFIFVAGCILEAVYCLLWKVSHFRTFVSGAVKTSGGIAAVFAVDPNPSISFLIGLFLWLFFWEIGGQNVPADWTDVEEDRSLKAETIPVRYGPEKASAIVLATLVLTLLMNVLLLQLTPYPFGVLHAAMAFIAGVYLLLMPARRLFRSRERDHASVLFNRASYYPLALLGVVTVRLII